MVDASLTPDRGGIAHRLPPHWLTDDANYVNALVSSIYRRQMKRHSFPRSAESLTASRPDILTYILRVHAFFYFNNIKYPPPPVRSGVKIVNEIAFALFISFGIAAFSEVSSLRTDEISLVSRYKKLSLAVIRTAVLGSRIIE
jgi:hypothetical protein